MASSLPKTTLLTLLFILSLGLVGISAKLTTDFYCYSCPRVFSVVKPVVESAISAQKRNGASILRQFFHDCFVDGCDGSVLLDDTKNFRGEKNALPNKGSLRAFEWIDKIKERVEKACPGVVSCADILAIASRDAVVILGGPSWDVKLGRRDSRTANFSGANTDIPPPTSDLNALVSKFAAKGLSVKDMVALSGSHTIGKSRCTSFRGHIYNDTNINPGFAKQRQANCPRRVGSGDNNLAPLDLQTENVFDNVYYNNLVAKKGLLHSDQALFSGGSTDSRVSRYAGSTASFFADFVEGMIRMGDVTPLTGSHGEIRKNCRKIN